MGNKLKVLDLFAGVGGLTFGFANDDTFEVVAANEILPNMAQAYSLNHPGVKMYVEDIQTFGASKLERDLGIRPGEIDIIIGGPPCQAYSTVGKREPGDPRGKLFEQYLRVLQEVNPRFFLFENVKGLLSMQKGQLLADIVSLFESLGYRVQYQLLNAADFGAPQIRERVILVGSKLPKPFHYPVATHYDPTRSSAPSRAGMQPYLTLGEAIGDLPLIPSGGTSTQYASAPQNKFQTLMRQNAPSQLMDHNAPQNNPNLIRMMQLLPDGGTPADLPAELRPKSGFKNTYCRLWWDKPSTTITRNLGTPSSSRCIHPKVARGLTTREGARLQCFRDDYKFFGSRTDKNLQIGNAVPTVLSTALAQAIAQHFSSHQQSSLVGRVRTVPADPKLTPEPAGTVLAS